MLTTVPCYLRTVRRQWGLTQREVGSLLRRQTRDRVSRLERGLSPPTAGEVLAFALIFGVKAEALFPALYAEQEDGVLDGAYRLSIVIEEGDDTPLSTRKRELLQAIFARAAEGVKRPLP